MNDLQDELNREIIGEHYSHPRHFCHLGDDALALENPSCGDKVKLALRPADACSGAHGVDRTASDGDGSAASGMDDGGRIASGANDGAALEICFEGSGCSISTASASMMAELLSGKSRKEAIETTKTVLAAFRGELPPETLEKFGDIAALSGVAKLPVRVKCATLAWQGALRLLENSAGPERR